MASFRSHALNKYYKNQAEKLAGISFKSEFLAEDIEKTIAAFVLNCDTYAYMTKIRDWGLCREFFES